MFLISYLIVELEEDDVALMLPQGVAYPMLEIVQRSLICRIVKALPLAALEIFPRDKVTKLLRKPERSLNGGSLRRSR